MLIVPFAAAILAMCFANGLFGGPDILIRMIPGIFLILVALATAQAMGYGDGLVILLVGLLLDIRITIALVMAALALSAVASLIILITKKGDRRTRLPFMPFLLAAWVVVVGNL